MKRKLFEGQSMAEALKPVAESIAPINADAVYPLEVFKRLTGLETASIRKMRVDGFAVRRIGRRSYVLGRDFLNWCAAAPKVAT